MNNSKILYSITITIVLCSLLSCTPLLIGGGGIALIAGGKILTQEKTIGESISDTTIWTKIRTGLANKGTDHVLGTINIEVNEGRVLLTGTVPDKFKILTILKVCWNVSGVKEVINELQITGKDHSYKMSQQAIDVWVTTKIKSKMLANTTIKSINYTVETINGTVYIFGIARSQEELDTVIDLISNTAHVKKVVSYVRAKKEIYNRISATTGNKSMLQAKIIDDDDPVNYNFDYEDTSDPKVIQPNVVDGQHNTSHNEAEDAIFEKDE